MPLLAVTRFRRRDALDRLVVALMAPTLTVIMTMSMVAVALPSLRDEFALDADVAAWLLVAYTLPFMMFMPLYGRLAAIFGKKTLLITGIVVFIAGTIALAFAASLPMVFVARVVQGAGSAAVNPLAMAIIIGAAPPERRGSSLGTWNSIGPVAGIIGPLVAGPIIDGWGWRWMVAPSLVVALPALVFAIKAVPHDPAAARAEIPTLLARFDWLGVLLLNISILLLVFYTSSRPVTGVDPLLDYRLAVALIVTMLLFVGYERRRSDPFIDLRLFRNRNFTVASVSVGIRMALMGSISLVIPLLVTDLYGLPASITGFLLMLHAAALLGTMRLGGFWIDRFKSKYQIVIGLAVEAVAMVAFAVITDDTPPAWIVGAIILHGMGAGSVLAALHIFGLSSIPKELAATAAGVYSMVRFGGSMLGTTIGGVILYAGIDRHGPVAAAYTPSFWFYVALSVAAAFIALGLQSAALREP